MSRQQYEQRPEVRLKRHLKNIDTEYVKKRKLYAEKPEVKERRKSLNNRRRVLCSNLITLLKNGQLFIQQGEQHNVLQNKRGRLVSGTDVLNCGKNGAIAKIGFTQETDLEDPKYDQLPVVQNDLDYQNLLDEYEAWCKLNNLDASNKDSLKEFLNLKNDRTGKPDKGESGGGDSTEESQ